MITSIALGVALLLGGCVKDPADSKSLDGTLRGELVIFAAASLTDAFGAVVRDFQAQHPGVVVKTNFAGSQSLRTQIENGAAPHLFASANPKHMHLLRTAGLVEQPVFFARNELVIVVPADNPAHVDSLETLPRAKRIVLAGKSVPAGAYAERMLTHAARSFGDEFVTQVKAHVVSRETDVRQTLQKVVLGEADAAIVYATDAASAGDKVRTIKIPREHNVIASYPLAVVSESSASSLAQAFADFILSQSGQERIAEFGFGPGATKDAATSTTAAL